MNSERDDFFSGKPTSKDIEIFAERIKIRINDRGISLNKLTIKLGWGAGLLNKILKGQRSIRRDLIKEMAQALNCSPDELVEGTGLAPMMQSIEPSLEMQNISTLQMKVEQLENEILAYKELESVNQNELEKLARENQKNKGELLLKETELSNYKKITEENLRLKNELNRSQSDAQRVRSIAESERVKNISLKRLYDEQQAWIQQLRIELENAHKLENFKAVLAGFGGLFVGSLIGGTSKEPTSARQLAEMRKNGQFQGQAGNEPTSAFAVYESLKTRK